MAALAAHNDIVEIEDLIEEGTLGVRVGDVFVGDEGVVAGEETFLINDHVVVNAIGPPAKIEDAHNEVGEVQGHDSTDGP